MMSYWSYKKRLKKQQKRHDEANKSDKRVRMAGPYIDDNDQSLWRNTIEAAKSAAMKHINKKANFAYETVSFTKLSKQPYRWILE